MNSYESFVTLLNINDGAQGEAAQQYRIETNQSEILKYFTQEDNWKFVPEEFSISIYKFAPEEPDGEKQLLINKIQDWLTFFVFNNSEWQNFNIPQNKEGLSFFSILDGKLILYPNNFKIYAKREKLDNETDEEYLNRINSSDYKAIKILTEKETVLKIRFEFTNELNNFFFSERNINIRHAMSEDMAKLAIKADGIYASIASTALNFNSNGLIVKNGGLKIARHYYSQVQIDEESFPNGIYYIFINNEYVQTDQYIDDTIYYEKKEEDVFYGDKLGNLTIKGTVYANDGEFTGKVIATSGEFTGTIKANNGTIGGFNINENFLTSIGKINNTESPSIILNGTNGEIFAQKIELGTGAIISEYLQLGDNVKIWNPEKNNRGNFLEVTPGLTFNKNGTIILGKEDSPQIKIDGPAQEIRGWDPGTDNINFTWSITPDQAIFNNISARGSIKAASFEYGVVQAIGGVMLVRPSSRIVSINGTQVVLDSVQSGFEKGDICLLENTRGESLYYKIEEVNEDTIILDGNPSINFIGSPIINLGKTKSIGIGINGSRNETYKIPPNSISVLEFDGSNSLIPKIILGKLPDNQDTFGPATGSYGLYAENVVLNGSLTTKTLAQSSSAQTYSEKSSYNYSGIGTTIYNGAPSTVEMIERFPKAINRGQILLWAGANDSSAEGIQNSKFFVDEYGNMYAGSGYFDGTIITNSTIEAAEIRTMKLTGTGKISDNGDSIPALSIQDVNEGIHFYRNNKEGASDLVFQLSANNFKVNDLQISLNDNFIINKEGNLGLFKIQMKEFNEVEEMVDAMLITGKKIKYLDSFIELPGEANIIMSPDNYNKFIINQSGLSISGSLFYTYNNEIRSEYKQIIENEEVIGYDLYIY